MSIEIFEDLSVALINLDEQRYLDVLAKVKIPLQELHTIEKNNSNFKIVLHELSLSITKENYLLQFFSKICFVTGREQSTDEDVVKVLLDQQNIDGKTPLHLGIMTGRKVKSN